MIDFHSHILPGVDDGSTHLDMSVDMLNISINEGVHEICATPHFIVGEYEIQREDYEKRVDELRSTYINDEIKILNGLELYIHPDLPKLYKNKRIWGLNDTLYLLIELPMQEYPVYTEKLFYQLRLEGAVPIIAHPERNTRIMQNNELLVNLVQQGTLVQMNAGSLRGIYGTTVQKCAEKFVSMNMVHMIGSDGHSSTKRTTRICDGYSKIKALNENLYQWIIENEKSIVDGKAVELPEIKAIKKKRSFFELFTSKVSTK
jgi:protein-tyrosine phosphatase